MHAAAVLRRRRSAETLRSPLPVAEALRGRRSSHRRRLGPRAATPRSQRARRRGRSSASSGAPRSPDRPGNRSPRPRSAPSPRRGPIIEVRHHDRSSHKRPSADPELATRAGVRTTDRTSRLRSGAGAGNVGARGRAVVPEDRRDRRRIDQRRPQGRDRRGVLVVGRRAVGCPGPGFRRRNSEASLPGHALRRRGSAQRHRSCSSRHATGSHHKVATLRRADRGQGDRRLPQYKLSDVQVTSVQHSDSEAARPWSSSRCSTASSR